ncbi:MAG: hypothetical protein HY704_03165, partial [Gemmatimonadetes bacterium]|nr:hypothetical protein [Gemmatimonadota bacterium]
MVSKQRSGARFGFVFLAVVLAGAGVAREAWAQRAQGSRAPVSPVSNEVVNPGLYQALEYRMIGPYRGGRAT